MTTTAHDDRGTTSTTTGTADHVTRLLVPVRGGELLKISTTCTCGWRSVGIAGTRDEAYARAHRLIEDHVEAASLAETPSVAEVDGAGRSLRTAVWSVLVAAVIMAVVLAGGLDLLSDAGGLELIGFGR